MIHGPDRTMGAGAWKRNLSIKIFLVAFQTVFFCRNYHFGILFVAGSACLIFLQISLMFIMIELDCQGWAHKETYQNSIQESKYV